MEISKGKCSICNKFYTDCDDNLMVYCDKCDIGCHQQCYGYPIDTNVPDNEWYCDTCKYDNNPICMLCPNKNGVMKRTTCWRWCHIQCALCMLSF